MAGKIRVGVIGVGRGERLAEGTGAWDELDLVALCDTWEDRLEKAGRRLGVAVYTDYDEFLGHDMDAVILANYFHEHAPFAIKALKAGKHVMSETTANSTLAEGVALCRVVEQTGLTYMLAENYPFTRFNLEMRRVYQSGEIGAVKYAEGEYNHPGEFHWARRLAPGSHHWLNWIPSTYYCTHALAPLVYMTDAWPIRVNALSIADPEVNQTTVRRGDPGSVILCRMTGGSVFRIFGLMLPGDSRWYRVHGTKGAMENVRGSESWGSGQVRVWHEEWDCPDGVPVDRIYEPGWPSHKDLAGKFGHGGGDFWINKQFIDAIRTGKPPFFDVYRSVAISSVGILAWKSALEEGTPFEIPDFKKDSERHRWEDDNWSPWPKDAGPGQPPPSILGTIEPKPEDLARAREIWREMGYEGQ